MSFYCFMEPARIWITMFFSCNEWSSIKILGTSRSYKNSSSIMNKPLPSVIKMKFHDVCSQILKWELPKIMSWFRLPFHRGTGEGINVHEYYHIFKIWNLHMIGDVKVYRYFCRLGLHAGTYMYSPSISLDLHMSLRESDSEILVFYLVCWWW